MSFERASGVLMHISSLPGDYSVGSLGKWAYNFVDLLRDAGFSYWQILPLNMTDEYGSPYKSVGYYSSNPYFIDLDILGSEGLLTENEINACRQEDGYSVEYERLVGGRLDVLRLAAGRVEGRERVEKFVSSRKKIASVAHYLALRDINGAKPFSEWQIRDPDPERLFFWQFIQYEFHRQWQSLKDYANSKGVRLIGDMPIYVDLESADVWSEPECFDLDPDMLPREVSGVPPDYFSAEGQLWGNPLYNFEYMKENGYLFWKERIDHALSMFDGVRIDHFRAFDEYYSIPYGANAREGKWRKGPGRDLIDRMRDWIGDKLIIAEDLGDITDSTRALLEYSGFPGMRVVQFGFLDSGQSPHQPHSYPKNSVAYTGTHDNATLLEYVWGLGRESRELLFDYMGIRHNDWSLASFDIISALLRSPSFLAILPVQDLLGFGSDTRMNTPGKKMGNWRFRITEDDLYSLFKNSAKWKRINTIFGRNL